MSAIAVVVGKDALYLAADGIGFDPSSGTIKATSSKLILKSYLGTAFGAVGSGGLSLAMSHTIQKTIVDFDGALAQFPDQLRAVHATMLKVGVPPDEKGIMFIGGWSNARQRFEAHTIAIHTRKVGTGKEGEFEKVPPYALNKIDTGLWVSSIPNPETMKRFGVFDGHPELEVAARLVCALRACSGFNIIEPNGYYGAGVFLEVGILKRDMAISWIAHRWPETFGDVVDPGAGEPMPVFPLRPPAWVSDLAASSARLDRRRSRR